MRSAVLNEYRLNGFTVYENAHIGSGALFFGPNVPSGWMPCDGRALSRADYAKLFAEIGTYWGAGDGSTTFNIPDLRDRVPQGADATSLGDYIEAGLPNITGSYRGGQDATKNINVLEADGAFYGDDYKTSADDSSNNRDTTYNKLLKFDASRSSSVYKDDCDTVQPPAAACYIIIKVTDAGNSGGGSALVPDMTEAEYNALSPEEQNNGQIRHITDAEETPVPFAVVNDTITTSANVWTASKVKEGITNFLVDGEQVNPNDIQYEYGTRTTSGEIRTITLDGNYSEMLDFDLIYNAELSTFKVRNISFNNNVVSFTLAHPSAPTYTSPLTCKYKFVGIKAKETTD